MEATTEEAKYRQTIWLAFSGSIYKRFVQEGGLTMNNENPTIKSPQGVPVIRIGEHYQLPGLGHVEILSLKCNAPTIWDPHVMQQGKALLHLYDNKVTPRAILGYTVWDVTQGSRYGVDFYHGKYFREVGEAEGVWNND